MIGYSLGWEISVGRLQVDLRGSSSSDPGCPSISFFRIIQLVLCRWRSDDRRGGGEQKKKKKEEEVKEKREEEVNGIRCRDR